MNTEELRLMGQVSAASTILVDADPAATLAAVADYENVRPKILSPHYSEYEVLQGGQGSGTIAKWKLQATKSRVRDVEVNVDVAGHTVIEKDANSSMVTNWTVAPAGPGSSVTVKHQLEWRRWHRRVLRKDLCAAGVEKDPGRGAGQPEERTGGLTRRRRALARLALGGQEAGDAADHCVGVFLPAFGRFHQRRIGGVLHVA